MKSLMLAGTITSVIGTVCLGSNRSSASHDPLMRDRHPQSAVIGDIWLEDGPYGSLNDAKLPRSTTGACPKDDRRAG
jgi:hypothetical protein